MKKLLFLLLLVLAGCGKGEENGPVTIGSITVAHRDEMNQTHFADGERGGFTFTAAEPWTASVRGTEAKSAAEGPDWIRLDRYSGPAGTFTLAIEFGTNRTGERRTASIAIVCGDTEISVTVTQEAVTEEGKMPDEDEPVNPDRPEEEMAVVEIPDARFRQLLFDRYGCGQEGDGTIRQYELNEIEVLDCPEQGISSLEGIRNFRNLAELDCGGNPLVSLDLSGMERLVKLSVSSLGSTGSGVEPMLVSLDVTGCTALEEISAGGLKGEPFKGLETCGALQKLDISSSRLDKLSLAGHAGIRELYLRWGEFGDYEWVDVSDCANLTTLDCVSGTLRRLDVVGCRSLKNLAVSTEEPLSAFDLGGCAALETLECTHSGLKELDLMPCPALKSLTLYYNELEALDLSWCTKLESLDVSHNRLSAVDVRSNPDLEYLDVQGNQAGMNVYLLESHRAWPFELKADRDANVSYE